VNSFKPSFYHIQSKYIGLRMAHDVRK